jgi:hypothetical protein
MKFEQYVQLVSSFMMLVLSPTLCYFGVFAWQLNRSALIVDLALIVLTVAMFLTALVQLGAAVKVKLRVFVGLLYVNLLLSCFLALLVVGLLILNAEMQDYLASLTGIYSPEQRA